MKKNILALSSVVILLAACGDSPAPTAPPATTSPGAGAVAYTNANIWDGTGAAPLANAHLVVRDGRVESVGTGDAPTGAGIVDLGGAWVVPGFINAHGHVSGRWAADDVQGEAARAEGDLTLYARYGITTLLSLGGAPAGAFGIRGEQQSASLDRARLMVAGDRIFSQDPAEVAAMTRANVDAGVDWIKLRVDDNLGTAEKMSPDALAAAIEVARAADLPVATHIYYMDDAAMMLEMGTSLIAHSVRDQQVSDEFVQTIVDSGICYVPTLVREVVSFIYGERPEFFDDPFFLEAAKQSQIDRVSDPEFMERMATSTTAPVYRKALVQAQENLAILIGSGVPIAFGTDSGPAGRFPGYLEYLEFKLMSEAGLTPEEILLSATSVAADCLQLDDVGTLEAGKWADFVVLEQNPLNDIDAVRSMTGVYVAGNAVPR
jgi:imidazolonepropionase-like amidohydrolase